MEVEIRPEPTAEERAAILTALERVRDEEDGDPGSWWKAGLRESIEGEDDNECE